MKIDKKTKKELKAGNINTLLKGIEYLVDTYNEDKFDLGYQAGMSDLGVHAYRIAQILYEESLKSKDYGFLDTEQTEEIIKDYFRKL